MNLNVFISEMSFQVIKPREEVRQIQRRDEGVGIGHSMKRLVWKKQGGPAASVCAKDNRVMSSVLMGGSQTHNIY